MAPVSPVIPLDIPAEHLATRTLVPMFTPPGSNQIHAPGTGGGANYGPLSYSPRTGFLYVNAIDSPTDAGRGPRGYFSAYDPTTGELAWQKTFEGYGQAGSVVTAGDVVFVGTGSNIAGYFLRSMPRVVSCSGNSTPAPASFHHRRCTASTASSS
jgi:hypothetical protein